MMARLSRSMTLTAVLAVVLAAGRPALAQGFDFRALLPSGLITGAVPSSTEVPSAPPWSGETGASGHPAMQAEAIRAAAAGFHDCLDRLASEAAHRGISRAEFDRQTAGLAPDLRIMDLLDSQPEFTKSFWNYLESLITDERIETGRALLAKHQATFAAVEKAYGVDRYVI